VKKFEPFERHVTDIVRVYNVISMPELAQFAGEEIDTEGREERENSPL
jgi:hypothetical protein